jgi:hypothetical protein
MLAINTPCILRQFAVYKLRGMLVRERERERDAETEALKPVVSQVIRSMDRREGETDVSSLPLHFTENKAAFYSLS